MNPSLVTRHRWSDVVFIVLVVLVPLGFGIGWAERQRTNDIRDVQRAVNRQAVINDWELYDGLVLSCQGGNVIRRKQNKVVGQLHQSGFLLDVPLTVIPDCLRLVAQPGSRRPADR